MASKVDGTDFVNADSGIVTVQDMNTGFYTANFCITETLYMTLTGQLELLQQVCFLLYHAFYLKVEVLNVGQCLRRSFNSKIQKLKIP